MSPTFDTLTVSHCVRITSAVRGAGERALCWLAYTGVLVGAAGASTAITASLLMGEAPRASLAIVAFAATLSSYGIDRLVDRARDEHALRSAVMGRGPGLPAICFGLFAVAVALAAFAAGPAAAAILVGMPLTVALYVAPWLDRIAPGLGRRGIRRIKDIPLIKAFYVTGCWLLFVPLAALFADHPLDLRLLPTVAGIIGFVFVDAVACDLRDIAADRAARVLTFPVLLGPARTVRMLRRINAIWALAVVVGCLTGALPAAMWTLTIQGWLVDRCLVRVGGVGADVTYYCDVCFDGVVALYPLIFVVGVVAGRTLQCNPTT